MKKSQFSIIINRNSRPVWLLAIGAWPSFRSITATRSILLGAIFFVIFFIAPFSVSAATINKPSNLFNLKNGLVGYWTFDGKDMFIGAVLDKSGNGNTGNLINIATSTFYTAGKNGQGFRFDGVDDYVNIPYNASLRPTTAVTYAFWVKKAPIQNNVAPVILDTNNDNHRIYYASQTSSSLRIILNTTGSTGFNTTIGTIPNNAWTHTAVTYNGSNIITYINGAVTGITATSSNLVADTGPERIGCRDNPCTRGSAGALDDVRIYNRALSAVEVRQLYNLGGDKIAKTVAPVNNLKSGLVGYWTFDGKDMLNGAVKDKSGNNNTGNLVNIATSTFYTAGKIGQGARFFNSNNYLRTTSSVIGASATSICAWINPKDYGGGTLARIFDNNDGTNGISLRMSGSSLSIDLQTITGKTTTAAINAMRNRFNMWSHVCVTRDSVGQSTFYINGVLSGTPNQDSGTPTASSLSYAQIGNAVSPFNRGFNGVIDDVRIYNRALSAGEIRQLYNLGGDKIAKTVAPVNNLKNGLVGYWTFDGKDMLNGAVKDMSGNGNTGNLKNIATSTFYTAGKIGQGFRFDGVNDYMWATSTMFDLTSDMSMGGWIYFNSLPPSSDYDGFIFKQGSGSGTIRQGYAVQPQTSAGGVTTFLANWGIDNFYDSITCNQVIATKVWYHVIITRSGTQEKCYINGALDKQGTGLATFNNSVTNLEIGRNWADNSHTLKGLIDDVRIYNRALSAAEIKQLYNMGR